MNHRETDFQKKFAAAASYLKCKPHELASLKIREDAVGHADYNELFKQLEQEAGFRISPAKGIFQGNAYIVENSKTKVIVVEHETGLEILSAAASVTTLIVAIPVIIQMWSDLRNHFHRSNRASTFQSIETRRVNKSGQLSEDTIAALSGRHSTSLSVVNMTMLSAAEIIDSEVQKLQKALNLLTKRVSALEGCSPAKKSKTSKRPKKDGD